MAKFCIHCGKKLEEGQICDCQKNQTTSNQTSDLINKLLDVFKGMFVQPMDTLKKYTTNKEFTLGIILVGIFAIATSILSLSIPHDFPRKTSSYNCAICSQLYASLIRRLAFLPNCLISSSDILSALLMIPARSPSCLLQ